MKLYFSLSALCCLSLICGTSYAQIHTLKNSFETGPFEVIPVITDFTATSDSTLLNPDDYEAYMESGVSKLRKGNTKSAIWFFNKALEIYQASFNTNISGRISGDNNPYPDYYLGICYEELNQINSALIHYRRAIDRMPYFTLALNEIAQLYFSMEKIDSALHYYDRVLKVNPKHEIGLFNAAYCYFSLGNVEKARSLLKQNIEVNPEFFTICKR